MVDDTYIKLSMYWDGVSKVRFYVNRSLKVTHTTNNPDDVNMTITLHHQNGEAAIQTLTVDYIHVVAERT